MDAAEFVIKLTQQVSGPAGVATSALAKLEQQIAKEQQAVQQLGVAFKGGAFRDAQGRFVSADDIQKVQGMHASLGQLNGALGGFKAAAAAEAADKARGPMRDFGDSMLEAGQSAFTLPGPLGKVQEALGKLGPEGQAAGVAIGIATVALTAFVVAIAGGAAAAISLTERLGAMRTAFDALGGGAAVGGKVQAMVERLSQSLPFATQQIGQWAASLLAAGVPASQLESRIKAIAAAEALMRAAGGGGGEAAAAIFKKLGAGGAEADAFLKKIAKGGKQADAELKTMGLTLAELGGAAKVAKMSASELADAIAKALQKKGAGPLDEMGSTIDVIAMKAKEGLLSLFDQLGPSVKPFMGALKALFGEFSKGGAAIKVLKPIVTTVFSALFSWGTRALTAIRAGLLQVIIWGLKAYIALHPLLAKIKEFATSDRFITGLKVAFVLLGVGIALALAPMIILAALFMGLVAVFTAVVAAIIYVAGAIADFVSGAASALAAWVASAAGVASDFIAGLVNGITGGAGAFAAAVTNMARGAVAALKGALGIHSPSAVAKDAASNVTGTFADTVDDGSKDVNKSMASMVDPSAMNPKGGGRGKRGDAGGKSVTFSNCTFGTVTEADVRRWVLAALDAEAEGGPEPEGAF